MFFFTLFGKIKLTPKCECNIYGHAKVDGVVSRWFEFGFGFEFVVRVWVWIWIGARGGEELVKVTRGDWIHLEPTHQRTRDLGGFGGAFNETWGFIIGFCVLGVGHNPTP